MGAWLLLAVSILFEVMGTMSMKLSDGFSHLLPTLSVFGCYAVSFTLLVMILKKLNVSIVYAIWAGAGTAIVSVLSVVLFNEAMNLLTVLGIVAVIVGVIVIKLAPVEQNQKI